MSGLRLTVKSTVKTSGRRKLSFTPLTKNNQIMSIPITEYLKIYQTGTIRTDNSEIIPTVSSLFQFPGPCLRAERRFGLALYRRIILKNTGGPLSSLFLPGKPPKIPLNRGFESLRTECSPFPSYSPLCLRDDPT